MAGNDERKLSYEKPEVVIWPAADYVLAVNDCGDGGTPSLTSQMSIESWDAGAMTGEAGYAGTFVDNKTFAEAS